MSENIFTPTTRENNQLSVAGNSLATRQAQEVQAAMVIAKRFPRDEFEAFERIRKACQRKNLAESAVYEFPRGGTKVSGPSIRLAEALAQNWGNIDFGIMELEQKGNESSVMAYAWDLETNTRQTKIFTVPHIRYTKASGNTRLTDPRDIYEMVANQGARRLRACILGVIPGDVVDSAVEMCNKTLKDSLDGPIEDTVKKLLAIFKDKFGVTKEMIEKYLGYNADSFTAQDIVKLRGVYSSLKDGMSMREDFFDMGNKASSDDKTKAKNILEPDNAEPEPKPEPEKNKSKANKQSKKTNTTEEALEDMLNELGDELPDCFKEQIDE